MSMLRAFGLATALIALPLSANAEIINFDVDGSGAPIAPNTPITSQYGSLGVWFEGYENGALVDINAGPDPDSVTAPSSPNVMTNCSAALRGCPGNRADILRILFDTPVTGISLMLDTLGGQSVTFNLYAASGLLLETLSVTSGSSVYVPVSFSASNVRRIDGLQPTDSWGWAFDDLTFTVPTPGTLALFSLAGIVLLGARRRRQA